MSGGLQNQLPTVGEMDELIGFSTLTRVIDDWGNETESWSVPTPDIRAKVRYIITSESESAIKQEKFTQEIKIHLRYLSTATEVKKVLWRSDYYDIYAIEFTPRQRFMVIKARLIET